MKSKILFIYKDDTGKDNFKKAIASSYNVCLASSVQEVFSRKRPFHPLSVIFQMQKPDAETLQDLAMLKAQLNPSTSIIAIALENSREMEKNLRRIGIFYYLIEPYEFQDLRELVKAAVHFSKSHSETCQRSF